MIQLAVNAKIVKNSGVLIKLKVGNELYGTLKASSITRKDESLLK